jgi:triphosphatase
MLVGVNSPGPERREIELKLGVPAESLSRLQRLLRDQSAERAITHRVDSVYWDTESLALYRAGVALRLRQTDGGWIQTVKDRGTRQAGLFDRREDEVAVEEPVPRPERVQDPSLRAALDSALALEGSALSPVVETDVRRSRRIVYRGEDEIEVCLDVGQVRTQAGEVPLSELELELRSGSPAALFDLALAIHERVPLRPAGADKPTVGFRLLTGEIAEPMRGRPVALARDASLDEALAEMCGSCLEQIVANEAPAREGHDVEGVHQLRVGVRRLRSALSILKRAIPQEQTEALGRELRWLGGALGPARDIDVFLTEILEPVLRARDGDGALKRLRDEAIAMRAEVYGQVRAALDSPRYTGLVLRAGRWLADREWRLQPLTPESARLFAPARHTAQEMLSRRLGRARRRAESARTPGERHALRIELKKLRYAADFFAALFPEKQSRRYLRRLSKLQDVLGVLNDVATADRVVDTLLQRMQAEASVTEQRAAGIVVGWWSARAEQDLEQLERRWKKLGATEPFWE